MKLKPCPFCGSEDVAIKDEVYDYNPFDLTYWHVVCGGCEASSNEFHGHSKWTAKWENVPDDPQSAAVEAWNRRHAKTIA
jgi:Lar family restriction alleviation protein